MIAADIESRPNAQLYSDLGLYFGEHKGEALALTAREERFMSQLADRIPFIGKGAQASQRAYLGYLNKIRADVFDKVDAGFRAAGLDPARDQETYESLAKYINYATGRGNLGKYGERAAPLLNVMIFSPRLQMARLQLTKMMFSPTTPKMVRKQAWKDMSKFVAAGLTLVGLAKFAGAEVETDPRSSDFMKMKSGEKRIDP